MAEMAELEMTQDEYVTRLEKKVARLVIERDGALEMCAELLAQRKALQEQAQRGTQEVNGTAPAPIPIAQW